MHVIWGIVVLIVSMIGWVGQAITAFAPQLAVKLGVTEPEAGVDPLFHADVRGEAYWDVLTIWTLPVAGLLLILGSDAWAYFGLVGGGMYVYFAGRGIFVRRMMQQRGMRIGKPDAVRTTMTFLAVWGVIGIVTIIAAVAALS